MTELTKERVKEKIRIKQLERGYDALKGLTGKWKARAEKAEAENERLTNAILELGNQAAENLSCAEKAEAELEKVEAESIETSKEFWKSRVTIDDLKAELAKFKDLYEKTDREMDFIHERANIRETALRGENERLNSHLKAATDSKNRAIHRWHTEWTRAEKAEAENEEFKDDLLDAQGDVASNKAQADSFAKIANELKAQLAKQAPLIEAVKNRPKVVCFCGSVRFSAEMMIWAWEGAAKNGIIVLSWHVLPDGYFSGADDLNCVHGAEVDGVREQVDELHKRKIDLADEVWVVNVRGYIGDSTKSEVAYAHDHGKPIIWLEPEHAKENLRAALALKMENK